MNDKITLTDHALVALIVDAFPLTTRAVAPPPLDIEWNALLDRARFHGLSPLLHAALDIRPRTDTPSEILETLTDVHRSSALATAAKYHELDALLPALASAALPCIVLKGAALAKWLYPAPDLRPFGDVDLLVQAHDAPRLRKLLETRGYRASGELAEGFRDAYYSEMAFAQNAPPHLALDAHWHLFVPLYFRARMDTQWFWERTIAFRPGMQPARILHPTAQLIHLTVHASLNHQHAPRLLWLYDLALLLTKHSAEIDWDAAAAFARASQVTRSVSDMLAQTEQWWGVAAPAPFLQTLRNTRVGWEERIAFALTAAPRNEARVLSDALAARGGRNKLRYAARHLLPDAAYMTQHYRIRRRALLPYYYARRVLESGWKFARSVLSAFAR